MNWLKQADAIASGILAITAGGVLLSFVSGNFLESFDQAWRQKEVMGTVIAQETTRVCQRTKRGNALKCLQWQKVLCPIVQYQPETGKLVKQTDCSLRLGVGTPVYVVYDSKAPENARTSLEEGTKYHWFPLLLAGVPVGVAGLLMVIGVARLWEGWKLRNANGL
ncbi:hypothetical protein JOY44_14490 [Phormidium sp. CLA17]|uniref:DUF3592 domain-containing protein n=1 Tax=Leptolyngbya sp. Cla-17 TaxID=2803751 RepID=UPI0014914FD8|nr:DUF3592 domain-containing protein [Leptolyngbya sp. Cla-17]MBM0742801.1 hypothetical protein [Leptolyngbya sp. Cla-17]